MPDLIFASKGAAEAIRNQERINEGARKLKDLYRADTQEAKRLESAAKRIYEQTRTPQEQMLQRIAKIKTAQKAGLIPPKEAESAIRRINRELENTRRKALDAGKGFGRFSGAMVTGLVSGITSALSLQRILTSVSQLLDETAAKQRASSKGLGNLVQLAGGDVSKRQKLISAAKQTFAEGGFNTLNESANLIFQLESAGALGQRAFFSQLQTVDEAADIAKTTALIRNNLGQAETGTLRQITSKVIAGALPATGVSPSDIARGSATAAVSAKALGLSDEELIAAVSRVSETTGSGDLAGTQVNSLLTALIKRGAADDPALKGKNFGGVLQSVIDRDLNQAELIEFFGRKEAAKAFGALRDVGGFGTRVVELFQADKSDLAGQTIANALGSTDIAVGRIGRGAAARKELSLERAGLGQAGQKATRDIIAARSLEAGASETRVVAEDVLQTIADFISFDSGRGVGRENLEALQQQQLDLLQQGVTATEETNGKIDETNRKLEDSGLIGGSG